MTTHTDLIARLLEAANEIERLREGLKIASTAVESLHLECDRHRQAANEHRNAAMEADLRTQAAVRSEKKALAERDTSSLYHVQYCQVQQRYKEVSDPATILELCALLEKAEEALKQSVVVRERLMRWRRNSWPTTDQESIVRGEYPLMDEALSAIKQWKEQT